MATAARKSQNLAKIARLQFAEFLRLKRIEANLSQMAVAKKLKLKSAQFVSNIERGLAPVPFQALKVLMNLYSIGYDELSEKYLELQKSVLRSELAEGPEFKKRAG